MLRMTAGILPLVAARMNKQTKLLKVIKKKKMFIVLKKEVHVTPKTEVLNI